MVEKEVQQFIVSFNEDNDVFSDNQDMLIHDKVERFDLLRFMHADVSYGIETFSPSTNNDYVIYPLVTLWPDTDGMIFIGANEYGNLVSYSIDTQAFKTSVFDITDLMVLISDKCDNKTLYDLLFNTKV